MPGTGKSRGVIDTGVSQLTILIRWCYGCEAQKSDHGFRVAKQPIKIRNETARNNQSTEAGVVINVV